MKEISKLLEKQFSDLLDGTGYANLDDFVRGIRNKSQGLIDGRNMPFFQLQWWVRTTQMHRLKLLVALKQSLI